MEKRTFYLLSIGVTLVAFALREWHVLASVIQQPTLGDVSGYLRYALHLVWDGTFSQAGNGEPVIPDAYRSPGYPVFLAALFKLSGPSWFAAVYQAQAVLGALTVAGTIALARQWMPAAWALLAGALLAVWPHHIAATNAMLVEVVFGVTLVCALLLASLAMTRRSMPLAFAAGLAFGCAYLVNPLIALFPVLLLVAFWRARALKLGAGILAVSLVAVAGWGMRNALQGAQADGRAYINLVQGSWPEYHDVQKDNWMGGERRRIHDAILAEIDLIGRDREAGLRSIADRITAKPVRHAAWYASKVYLLWAWDIRIGKGGIYTLGVENSPLDRPPLVATTILAWALNPALFVLAFAAALVAHRRTAPAMIPALLFLYVTAVHLVLQAEPRYAIAYRSVEIVLACGALAAIVGWVRAYSARPRALQSARP